MVMLSYGNKNRQVYVVHDFGGFTMSQGVATLYCLALGPVDESFWLSLCSIVPLSCMYYICQSTIGSDHFRQAQFTCIEFTFLYGANSVFAATLN